MDVDADADVDVDVDLDVDVDVGVDVHVHVHGDVLVVAEVTSVSLAWRGLLHSLYEMLVQSFSLEEKLWPNDYHAGLRIAFRV